MNKVSENPSKNRTNRQINNHTALMIVTALFVTSYLVSNVMAVKVISLFGLFYFDAGTIVFPFAYMLGDVDIGLNTGATNNSSRSKPGVQGILCFINFARLFPTPILE